MKHLKNYSNFTTSLNESYIDVKIEIKLPLVLGDQVRTEGRVISHITAISGEVDADLNIRVLRYSTDKVTRYGLADFNQPSDISESDYKNVVLRPEYQLGEEILFLNSTYREIGILKRGPVIKIEFNIARYGDTYWYRTKSTLLSVTETYTDVEDFIKRTKPKKALLDGQKYIFTRYSLQQNILEPVTVEKVSDTHFKILNGYDRGDTVRGSKLFNSHESFINHMTREV